MKKRTVAICTIMALLSVSAVFAQTETIPEARAGHSMVEIGGIIYLFGGESGTSREILSDLWQYTEGNSNWEERTPANPPPARKGHAATTWHDTMYACGGYTDTGVVMDVWKYDAATNEWTELPLGGANAPAPREYHSATVIGDDMYICGGLDADGMALGDLWRHSFSTGLWEVREDYLGACSGHASFEYEGFLYIFGGYDSQYSSFRNDIWFYDPLADDWDYVDAGGTLPSGRAFFAAARDSMGNLLIFGGRNETRTTAMSDNYRFDATTSTWTQLADGPAISDAAAVYINETSVYLFGGLGEFGDANNTLWKYDPSNDTWEEIVGVDDTEIIEPSGFSLFAYPNPFNPTTTISFDLPAGNVGDAEIAIFNVKGQIIREYPVAKSQSSIVWDGTDYSGRAVSSGIYFYQLSVNGASVSTNKCLLLK
ncbi:MAG: T9SS type A sorting domain-containing protein [Candidatus Cloacimonetes bacterium]|nr:T9SS type A sorting domain-containing protein [Candidatus Cloacimonadota bacterium]